MLLFLQANGGTKSLTGATMTDYFGIEAGTYGFVVNVLRDVFSLYLCRFWLESVKEVPSQPGQPDVWIRCWFR